MEHFIFFFMALFAIANAIALIFVRRVINGIWIFSFICSLLAAMIFLLGETFLALFYLGFFGLNSLVIFYLFLLAAPDGIEKESASRRLKNYLHGLVIWLPLLLITLVIFVPFAEVTLLPGDFSLELLGGEPIHYLGKVISTGYPFVFTGIMVFVLTSFVGGIILNSLQET